MANNMLKVCETEEWVKLMENYPSVANRVVTKLVKK